MAATRARKKAPRSRPRAPTPGPRSRKDERIDTVVEALALVETAGAVTLVPAGDRPSLVAAIVGGPVAGSWWSHPRGKAIFDIATELERSPDVLVAKLVDGKVTFVHKRVWPALYKVVTDPKGRAARTRGLPAAAKALLDRVEREGSVQCDGPADRAARKALEAGALVHATSEHTDAGHHAAVLTSWPTWASTDTRTAARKLPIALARATLAAAGISL
jgi:hypothetical protein